MIVYKLKRLERRSGVQNLKVSGFKGCLEECGTGGFSEIETQNILSRSALYF